MTEFEQFLKDFAEELYFRAAAAKGRDERMAIKGVQHSLERALAKHGKTTFARDPGRLEARANGNDEQDAQSVQGSTV